MLALFRQWFVGPLLWCGVGLGGLLISTVVGHFHPGLMKKVPVDLNSPTTKEIRFSTPTRMKIEVVLLLEKRRINENTSEWKRPNLDIQTENPRFVKVQYDGVWTVGREFVGFNYGWFVAKSGEEVIVKITPEIGVQIPTERKAAIELREFRPDWSASMIINYSAQSFGTICLLIGIVLLAKNARIHAKQLRKAP